ncbi:type IV pilus twitching motility protein PilT [Helicobacter cappadocius]|uniref:PilT/PilU family type 4a pilus ATPase n=1 Tax=Helicobacter cappadocius TaxID=3063998 RepID=A0AA90PI30_9HELI|nr:MULTISPECIES: PilT/PilU family type 4a pilus ATPase [unclassified Helicobacter]MDO7252349.1 PilT/PilU family type 4a pilus ATPase [Helicobacter sp. faydin-H75]MDP2538216.1 PilT/PilU family type 4a pilus ATPase [Helicobacter sp. faydin-H76]
MKNYNSIEFSDILSNALNLNASDIHIMGDGEVFFRICTQIVPAKIRLENIERFMQELLTPEEIHSIKTGEEKDISISYEGRRLRTNFYLSNTLPSMSFRILSEKIPDIETLSLPAIIKDVFSKTSGLILVSGATGSGKSTTIASALEYVNQNFCRHIICIEDPIEYLHKNIKSFFSHREIGKDTRDFASAIKSALRQDPDIIFIGELRDSESIKTALLASQLGHLVVATTHSTDATGTLSRIINSFGESRAEIALELSTSLEAIVSQELLSLPNGKLQAIVEILIATPAIKTLIRDQKYHQIPSQISMGREFGMISFEQSRKNVGL